MDVHDHTLNRARDAVLDALRRLAPELDPARLAPDRPLRDQVDLDSMDWLNLADAVSGSTGRTWPQDALAAGATLEALAEAIAAAPPCGGAAAPTLHRSPDGRSCRLRPLREDDAPLDQAFVRRLSGDSRYQRFMAAIAELPPSKLDSLTHIDQEHHLAIVATTAVDGREQLVGVARSIAEPDGATAEFAIVVADDWHGTGLAGALMRALIAAARAHRVRRLYGIVFATNRRMLAFVRRLGFESHPDADDRRLVRVELPLSP